MIKQARILGNAILFLVAVSCFIHPINARAQAIGDYISITNGNWVNGSTWGVVTGTGPLTWTVAAAAPATGNNAFIMSGTTVTVSGAGPYYCNTLNVQSGGKLFANSTGSNVYISVSGNIICNGQIGNFPSFDALSFNIDGASCNISGTGQFDSSRMRKNSAVATTNLTIDMNVNLWFPTNTTTQIYNNFGNTNFNVTIGVNGVVNLLSSGGFTGNASIDGLDGGAASANTIEAGGTWTINGTLIVSGKLYLQTNNTSTAYKCNWIVNGLVTAAEVVAGASGAGGSTLTVNAGGKLELSGTPAFSALSATNNVFSFASGSTVEYSATGNQTVRVASEFGGTTAQFQYGNLICSFSGTKACTVSGLYVKNDLRITGTAVLSPTSGSSVFVGGSWFNWGTGGYNEQFTTVRFNNPSGVNQTINCPGGEDFYFIVQNSGSNLLILNCNVRVTGGCQFASANGLIDLNSRDFWIDIPGSSAVTGGGINRYFISEKTNNSSRVRWSIGTGTTATSYLIPFGVFPVSATSFIPVILNKTNPSDIGVLSISTYGTAANNQPWPTTPTTVTNLQADTATYNAPDNRGYCVDRFWQIDATGTGFIDSLKFTYRTSELPNLDPTPSKMRAQRWVSSIQYWDRNQYGVASVVTSPAALNVVSVPGFSIFNTAWTLSSTTSPLPIELLSFKAENEEKVVRLYWSTATEVNNDHFILERSGDGKSFYPIASINGAGTTSMRTDYVYFDEQPLSELSYYRLKQIDFDGDYSYSHTVVINRNEGKGRLIAFPSPVQNNVYLTGSDLTGAVVRINTIQGAVLKELKIEQENAGVYELSVGDIQPGIYLLEVLSATERKTIRLVKE